jgi:serine/threonine protein phosphatase 1
MWGAKGFLESTYDWGKPVVFGHWSLPEPLMQSNKIGIDTGAFRSGRLTAVRLPDRQIFQVQRGLADSFLKQVKS